jgi:hypothetical protein
MRVAIIDKILKQPQSVGDFQDKHKQIRCLLWPSRDSDLFVPRIAVIRLDICAPYRVPGERQRTRPFR